MSLVAAVLAATTLAAVPCAPRAAARATPPAGALSGEKPADMRRARVPANLLRPLPTTGGIPRMAPKHARPGTPDEWARWDAEFRSLRQKQFGGTGAKARAAGLQAIRAVRTPAAFESLWAAMRGEQDDVRLAVLDTFAAGGDEGQYALACVAIQDPDKAIRAEATRRVGRPPCAAVLSAIDDGLRADNQDWVNSAGLLAGSSHAIEAIPALLFAQFAQGQAPGDTTGGTKRGRDLAWIAIGKTTSYVQNVVPVVGNNSGAYTPVIGQIIEGVVMEVADCVATIYHGDVHDSLVAMTSYETGTDTSRLAWDMRAWARWFDTEYVPMKRLEDEQLARQASATIGGACATPPTPPPAGRPPQ